MNNNPVPEVPNVPNVPDVPDVSNSIPNVVNGEVVNGSFFSRHKFFIIALLLIVIGISLYYAAKEKIIDIDLPSLTSGKSSDEIHRKIHSGKSTMGTDAHKKKDSKPSGDKKGKGKGKDKGKGKGKGTGKPGPKPDPKPDPKATPSTTASIDHFTNDNVSLCNQPTFVNAGDPGDYELSANVISDRGNACLKNCASEKGPFFVNNSADVPKGQPMAYIDTKSLEYSDFNEKCDEPGKVCGNNSQIIGKYSPGGLLLEEQDNNLKTTNTGLDLHSALVTKPQVKKPAVYLNKEILDNNNNVEHFAGSAAKLVLIVFLASWCPHCRTAKPHLDVFKKKHHKNEPINNVDVEVVEYDADEHKEEVKKHGVTSFPTYRLQVVDQEGESVMYDHDGGRTFDDLVSTCKNFVSKHL